MNTYLVCIALLLLLITSSIEMNLSRQKRDYPPQAAFIILNEAINNMNDTVHFHEAALSITKVQESLFDCHANSSGSNSIVILKKLQKLVEEVGSISSLFECTQMQENYPNLLLKITTLLDMYDTFYQIDEDEDIKNALIAKCEDNTEGINSIYITFRRFLNKDEVFDFFKNCAGYQSTNVNLWNKKIKQVAFLIVLLIRGCEEVIDRSTLFDPIRFINVVEAFTEYYVEINKREFVNDKDAFGLREKIKAILNEGKSAEETAQVLNQSFSYFAWDVIFYNSQIYRYEHHFTLYHPSDSHCGSEFYKRELNNKRNAIVSWCIHNNMDPNTIKIPEHEYSDARETGTIIYKANEVGNKLLNYVLCIKPPTDISIDGDCSGVPKGSGTVTDNRKLIYTLNQPNGNHFQDTLIAASWYIYQEDPKTPEVQFQTEYFMFTGKSRKIFTYNNTRLFGHYKQFTDESYYKCFQGCQREKECDAAAFYKPFKYNCFYFKSGFTKSMEFGWLSYLKKTN